MDAQLNSVGAKTVANLLSASFDRLFRSKKSTGEFGQRTIGVGALVGAAVGAVGTVIVGDADEGDAVGSDVVGAALGSAVGETLGELDDGLSDG